MIQQYSISNFGPFKDKASISLIPGKVVSRFEDNVNIIGRKKILKSAIIVGENAGGKTNFISGLHYLQYLAYTGSTPLKLDRLSYLYQEEGEQEFNLEVIIGKKKYDYSLVLDGNCIVREKLEIEDLSNKKNIVDTVFEVNRFSVVKEDDNIGLTYRFVLPEKYRGMVENSQEFDNTAELSGLFLNYFSILGFQEAKAFLKWLKESLIIKIHGNALNSIYENKESSVIRILKSKEYMDILRLIDGSIYEVKIDDKEPFDDSIIRRQLKDGNSFEIKLGDDSSGVRDFFEWAVYIWKVIYEGAVLFADEMDRVLNPILSSRIVKYIHGFENTGQFIFTTHNIFHLNTDTFMKEQLYFITKSREDLSSTVYSLASFENYRYSNNKVYDLYFKGLLGGTPND